MGVVVSLHKLKSGVDVAVAAGAVFVTVGVSVDWIVVVEVGTVIVAFSGVGLQLAKRMNKAAKAAKYTNVFNFQPATFNFQPLLLLLPLLSPSELHPG